MRTVVLLIILLIALDAPAQAADSILEQARSLNREGKYGDAKSLLQDFLKVHAGDGQTRLELACSHYYLKESKEGAGICRQLIRHSSDSMIRKRAWVLWGTIEDQEGNPKRALRTFKRGMREFPAWYLLPYNSAVTLFNEGKRDKALEMLKLSARLEPRHPSSHLMIYHIMTESKQRTPAVLALLRFLSLERSGGRAATVSKELQALLLSVITRDSAGIPGFYMDPSGLEQKGEDNFTVADLSFSLWCAAEALNETRGLSQESKLQKVLEALVLSLESSRKDQRGFFWETYVPFLSALRKNGHTGAFCALILQASGPASGAPETEDEKNRINSFLEWESSYKWPLN